MDRQWHIRPSRCGGGYFIDGVTYGTQPLTVEEQNAGMIVLRVPGHSWNASGIRGMPDIRYEPATMIVARIVARDGANMLIEPLLTWKPSKAQAKRRKAKAEKRP